jgi:hypothetical protein
MKTSSIGRYFAVRTILQLSYYLVGIHTINNIANEIKKLILKLKNSNP